MFQLLFYLFFFNKCTGMNFTHHMFLDPDKKYEMWWKFNDEEITVKLEVQTSGWLGWGLSPNGNMIGSDIMLAWFESDGKGKIQDTHAEGKYRPVADKQQDFHLIEMKKENNKITAVFKRKLLLCNEDDISITTDTMRVVYAYGDSVQPTYHQLNRGSHSVLLLNYGKSDAQLPNDTIQFDFRMNDNKTLEPKDTLYMCKVFKGPSVPGKHHLIRVEPIIQKGHESLVHHILLFECRGFQNESLLQTQHHCTPNMPSEMINCRAAIVHGWAIGGTTFDYPENVGLSYGDLDDPKYFIMELHYDNPQRLSTYRDRSGFRLYFTKTLRRFDANVLTTGVIAKPFTTIIPHNQKSFKLGGYCSSKCLGISNNETIRLFGGILHSHVHGRKILVRLVRDSDGVEVKRILQDLSYDFNFQEMKHLRNEIEIPPGHSIHVECTYNTEGRVKPVIGGRATVDEMCLAFLWHYPPLKRRWCLSINMPTFGNFQEKELDWKINYDGRNMGYIDQTLVIDGKNYSGQPAWKALTEAQVWNQNPGLAQKWSSALKKPKYAQQCGASSKYSTLDFNDLLRSNLTTALPDSRCVGASSTGIQTRVNPVMTLSSMLYIYVVFTVCILV